MFGLAILDDLRATQQLVTLAAIGAVVWLFATGKIEL